MQAPEKPFNERARLEALRSLNVLDTPAEERFDRLTRLAQRMFGVSIALVSLVDEDRQWFKSRAGLEASEMPRDISFCGHAILGNDIFIVPDTTKDQRFSDNPFVINDPNIRFYAGCPLHHIDGSRLGTLCIIDTKPRILSDDDLYVLQDLAELAERELAAVQLATLDELTCISNRRGFSILSQNSLNICARQHSHASLVFFDLNKFKQINDAHGHAEGDKALTVFAELMRNTFRESDVLARIGGDEFAVLLTNISITSAEELITKFRNSIKYYTRDGMCDYDISFSDGIVPIAPDNTLSIEELLDRADSLMYMNKHVMSYAENM